MTCPTANLFCSGLGHNIFILYILYASPFCWSVNIHLSFLLGPEHLVHSVRVAFHGLCTFVPNDVGVGEGEGTSSSVVQKRSREVRNIGSQQNDKRMEELGANRELTKSYKSPHPSQPSQHRTCLLSASSPISPPYRSVKPVAEPSFPPLSECCSPQSGVQSQGQGSASHSCRPRFGEKESQGTLEHLGGFRIACTRLLGMLRRISCTRPCEVTSSQSSRRRA